MLNLGLNAVHACNVTGVVTFETHYSPGEKIISIAVRDTGIGISEDKMADIFKPFYTTRTQGTGLGLAIAKEIVEMHKGEIWVENNPEKGCSFHIKLPAAV
jgi:signal transduction histidine kinase